LRGIKWDDIVLRFEWTFELDEMRKYIASHEVINEARRKKVELAFTRYPARFDLKTIKNFVKQIEVIERWEDEEDDFYKVIV